MEHSLVKYIDEFFKKIIEVYGLEIKTEVNEGNAYWIEYSSGQFVIKIERYFRELNVTLYKISKSNREINLFNLLEFLRQGNVQIPQSEYFRNEKDLEQCYKKQLNHLSDVIFDHYDSLNDFFTGADYKSNLAAFEKFWKNKHPEFYKRSSR